MSKTIFLIGFMGTGKTTLGKKLANKLNLPFLDTDHLLEEKFNMPISTYFEAHGEEAFRIAENNVLKRISLKEGVIATGGGLPCYFNNMETMNKSGTTIFLDRPAKELHHRLKHSKNSRPLISGLSDVELLEYIETKLKERLPFYSRAHILADREVQTAEQLCELIKDYTK